MCTQLYHYSSDMVNVSLFLLIKTLNLGFIEFFIFNKA